MSNFSDQLEEIKILLGSIPKSNKILAYSTLLHLHEQYSTDNFLVQSLAHSSHALLSSILVDINDEDEEIAALALKCLGFMTFHSSILAEVSVDDANMILDSLVNVITTTKIKSVCNLGVWCISTQQFNASFLATHLKSLLRAVVHALDNPIGSLSTTYEAIQAVMKLTTQISQMMRDMSYIWAPPIYRRLVSTDKREIDMSEKCLLKIRSTLFPPPLALSKAVVLDMKEKLLSSMKELANKGMKIRALQAWGWYIRLIGTYAVMNKNLVNEMLKIPQQTFSDSDSQVQIATLVAWEGLIDVLIQPPTKSTELNTKTEHGIQQEKSSKGNCSEATADKFSRRLNLIMMPLIGILSSKCDLSVRSHCLNTWSYLLHKLDISVNCSSVMNTVCLPIFELVFKVGPHSTNIPLWNFCLDILDIFALARSKDANDDSNKKSSGQLSANSPIKWLPWDLSQLDFFIEMVYILVSHTSIKNLAPEIKILACNAGLRIFRSVLKGLQNVFKNSSTTYTEIMSCLGATLTCVMKICKDMPQISLQFIEAVTEELEYSILGSAQYRMPLDLMYFDNFGSDSECRHMKIVGPCFKDDTNMVVPIGYLTVLCFGVVKSTMNSPEAASIEQGMFRFLRSLLSLYDPSEILNVEIGLLSRNLSFNGLNIWVIIVNCVKDYIDGVKDISLLKTVSDENGYLLICHLLCYPFAVIQRQRKLKTQHVIQVWKSLYDSVLHASRFESSSSLSFLENLSSMLSEFIDESKTMSASGTELDEGENLFVSLWGDVVIYILEEILKSELNCKKGKSDANSFRESIGISNSLKFAARFMTLIRTNASTISQTGLSVTSRFFSTLVRVVRFLHRKEYIISFIEIFSRPLLDWLSCEEVKDRNTIPQLQQLWNEILSSMQISWPPINFDSSFLDLQATLLDKTLNHANPLISEPTIAFWNSTYGEQINLDYPQTLLPVLEKLSRTEKIKLDNKAIASNKYKVTAMVNSGNSKRVRIVEDKELLSKRIKYEYLTEHQKEVRRAQQGKTRDCEGRGPGVRTYTSVDFSQGNEDEYSQESEDVLMADAILEKLKRDGVID